MTKRKRLKCPFCSEDEFFKAQKVDEINCRGFRLMCLHCKATGPLLMKNTNVISEDLFDELTKEWNRRSK